MKANELSVEVLLDLMLEMQSDFEKSESELEKKIFSERDRARLAEEESLKERRLRIDIEGRLSSVNSQLDDAQAALATERRMHAQTHSQMQAQITALVAEIRKPVNFPPAEKPSPPTNWRLEIVGRDAGNNMRTVKLIPE